MRPSGHARRRLSAPLAGLLALLSFGNPVPAQDGPAPADEERFLPPLRPDQHYRRAEQLLAEGKYDEADVELQVAIHQNDMSPVYHHVLGRLRLHQRRQEEALEEISKAIALDPHEPMYWEDLSLCHQARGDREAAVRVLQEGADLNPGDARLCHRLGTVLEGLGRADEAIRAHVRAIHAQPLFAAAYRAIAAIYRRQGNLDKAILFYEQSTRLDPYDLDAHRELGSLLLAHRGDPEAARAALEHVAAGNPRDRQAARLLVQVYHGLGADERAAEMRRRAAADGADAPAGDERLVLEVVRLGAYTVTASAPLRGEGTEGLTFELADAAASAPHRRFALVVGDPWRLIEHTAGGDAPIASFDANAPAYAEVRDALVEVLKRQAPPIPSEAVPAPAATDGSAEGSRRPDRRR